MDRSLSETTDALSLSEKLYEEKLARINDRIDHLEKLNAQWQEASERALKLQYEANQAHFEKLNGEQARMLTERDRTLPRETWETWREEADKQFTQHTQQLANVLGRTQGVSGAWALGIAALAALASISTVLLTLVRTH